MMQPWFPEAKFGIFLHWGIYSVKGITESWSFFNGEISYADYMAQMEGFSAANYDPEAWADLFQKAGATYAILTTKHHDGVALWDTQLSDLKVGKDLIGPFIDALRKRGMKVGLYFSHLDWSEPTYASLPTNGVYGNERDLSPHCTPANGVADEEAWERFLTFHRGQLKELCDLYQPDLLWFDGDWERETQRWRWPELRDQLQAWCPNVILNSRMGGYGDYETPEQGVPIVAPDGVWEFCVTLNDSWGYQVRDENHKSERQLIRLLSETIGMGGNLLLGTGPHADGSLQPVHIERLAAMGRWVDQHREAIFGTAAGLPCGHHYGPSTVSNDRTELYLFLFDPPQDQIAIKGLLNGIVRVSSVSSGEELAYQMVGGAPWNHVPGVLWIDVPSSACNELATVLKVELDGPLKLYRGSGHVIESN